MHPRLSRFPIDKPFERLEPDVPVSEVVLRLVVDLYSEAPVVIGTANRAVPPPVRNGETCS